MTKSILIIGVWLLNACGSSIHSLECTSLNEYHIEVDTFSSPLSFSWIGNDAYALSVVELSGVTVWSIRHQSKHLSDDIDDRNLIEAPVQYGKDFSSNTSITTLIDPLELVTGAEYNVITQWGCSTLKENSEVSIDTPFTAP